MIRQKGGGRSGVQRTPRFGAREQKIRSDEDTALSKLSPKDPKEFAKKFRDATGEPREKRHSTSQIQRKLDRDYTSRRIHTEKRSGRATPEIFLKFLKYCDQEKRKKEGEILEKFRA